MKKIFILTLMCMVIFCSSVYAMADEAFSACIMNTATGEVVWHKNGNAKHSMASTTKIMTALVALENSSIYDVVTISKNAAGTEGSSMYVHEGEQYLMHDMLYGLMLNSGNDAAIAIAEHISGSTQAFVELMNKKAYEFGALDTQFQNPNGLDHDGHYTTAYDLCIIASYALKNDAFREIVATKYREVYPQNSDRMISLGNHNKLLSRYDGCIGVKTGFTEKTGRCLVSAAERDGMTFVAVTLDDKHDWESHTQMLDYCFSEHTPFKVINENDCVRVIDVDTNSYKLVYKNSYSIPMRDQAPAVLVKNHITPSFVGGVNAGEKIGYAQIIYNDVVIDTVDIVCESEIPPLDTFKMRRSFLSIFNRVSENLLF